MRQILHVDLLGASPGARAAAGPSLAEVRGLAELEWEFASRERAPFALLRIGVEGIERLAPDPARRAEILRAVGELLRGHAKQGDLFAWREDDQVVACLTRTSPEAAETLGKPLVEAGRRLQIPGAKAPLRAGLSIGVAGSQSDVAYWFETLLAVAQDGLEVAGASGGERAVHTQLYGLRQRKLERENPGRAPAGKLAPGAAASRSGSAASAGHSPASSVGQAATSAGPAVAAGRSPVSAGPVSSSAPAAAAGEAPSPDRAFDARVRGAVAGATAGGASIEGIEEKVLSLAHEWAQEALRRALADAQRRHEDERELLERRIAKLARTLEEVEAELEQARAERNVDPGVPSAYRAVQGLSREERLYGRKLELLSKLVEANLEMRSRFGASA